MCCSLEPETGISCQTSEPLLLAGYAAGSTGMSRTSSSGTLLSPQTVSSPVLSYHYAVGHQDVLDVLLIVVLGRVEIRRQSGASSSGSC